MARTYHVKKAQQRYHTKPVLDPATGEPKRTPKMRRGVQMKSKSGRPLFMTVTERDLSRPKPMPRCSKCGHEIKVGEPYKYTETYNRTIFRCGTCPAPQVWEYSSSLSARIAQIEHEAGEEISAAASVEDLESARDNLANAVRELADEKGESAQNIVDGFGHETEQSDELQDISEQLGNWADDIENVDFPEQPEPEADTCDACNGTGGAECAECGGSGYANDGTECSECGGDGEIAGDCEECGGTGEVTPEEMSEDQLNEWLDEARTALEDVLGACPV